MTERCYISTEDLQELTSAATSHFSYINVTLYDDWGRPDRQVRQYYRDCDTGCCWYVPDYCCPVSSSDLLNRVVAIVVTLVLVTVVVVIIFCGGVILSRRRGRPFPWGRCRRQQQQPCLIPQNVTCSDGSQVHPQQQHQQLQTGFINFVQLPPPPPYDASTEEERVLWNLGLQNVSIPKPPDYDVLASGDVDMASQTPPPYSERSTLNSCDVNITVDNDATPPSYDHMICSTRDSPAYTQCGLSCNHENV